MCAAVGQTRGIEGFVGTQKFGPGASTRLPFETAQNGHRALRSKSRASTREGFGRPAEDPGQVHGGGVQGPRSPDPSDVEVGFKPFRVKETLGGFPTQNPRRRLCSFGGFPSEPSMCTFAIFSERPKCLSRVSCNLKRGAQVRGPMGPVWIRVHLDAYLALFF